MTTTYTANVDINYGAGFDGGCQVRLNAGDLRVLAATASALADEIEQETKPR